MCTSAIDHTSNCCYYVVMYMREIFCLRQGQDETTKAYYQRFEAAISTSELEKCTPIPHVEINNTYAGGDNKNGTNRFQVMCLLMSADSKCYSGI